MKYFKYDLNGDIFSQIEQWRSKLKQLAAMNHDFGITAVCKNHAGSNYLGATWDLKLALKGISRRTVSCNDIRHATAEGGMSWPLTFKMIQPSIDTVYVQDFVWKKKTRGLRTFREDRVDKKFFKMLAETGFSGPISFRRVSGPRNRNWSQSIWQQSKPIWQHFEPCSKQIDAAQLPTILHFQNASSLATIR